MSAAASLIYVDLVKDEPQSLSRFAQKNGWPADTTAEQNDTLAISYQAYLDRFQPFRLLIVSGDNHKPLFRSAESYFNRGDAVHAAQIAFGNQSNVYLREPEHGDVQLRLAAAQ